ncbi:MAG: hypothetical protein JWO22_2932 [Frankiales bacterium]|nr:hypothetical protein [Frankiales bacterium]
MALYIPEARRRRRVLVAAVLALVAGLVVGGLAGRLTAQSVDDRVKQVRADAQDTSAGLRVIAIHDSAGTGGGGTDLVLTRTDSELRSEFSKAPWISTTTRSALLDQLAALRSRTDPGTKAYGAAAEALAAAIDKAFTG